MSFGIKKIRFVTWILSLWLIFIFLCLSQNHIANTQELFDEEANFDLPSYVDLYPEDPKDRTQCIYLEKPFEHGDRWIQDECSRCFCNNGTTNCVYESCNPPCDFMEQVKIEGECCKKCPPKMTISKVNNLLAPDIEIVEGSDMDITFDVDIRIEKPQTSRQVHGVYLWKLNAWISKSFDGSGRKLSFADNVLSPEQQDSSFLKPSYPPWTFIDLSLTLDASTEGLCEDFKYLCVKFNEGDNSIPQFNLPFTFRPSNDDERRLVDCAPLGPCKGVIVRDFDWTIDAERAIPGELDDVTIDLTVFPRSDSRDVKGSGLWRATLFGSSDFEGLGTRYGEVSQIMNRKEAKKAVKNAKPMKFRDMETQFDLGIIGCIPEASYVCLEFRQGELPQPDFTLQFAGEGEEISDRESLVKCMPRKCGAKAVFSQLIPVITSPPSLIESTPGQRVNLNVTAISNKLLSTTVEGKNLWNMNVFFSSNANGTGNRIQEQIEILTPTHQKVPLRKDADINFKDVVFEVDLSNFVCSDIPFMCVELRKNPSASIDYEFGTYPEQDPFVGCLDMGDVCRGVIAKDLDWSGDIPDFVNDDVKPIQSITSNASIDVESVSRNITGNSLWQMSVFASSSRKARPDDVLLPYFDQILTDEQSRLPVPADGVLRFYNMQTPPFQVDRMGCGKFKYLCYKFQKAIRSDSDFAFHTLTGDKFVLNCKKMVCKAVTPTRLEWTIDAEERVLGSKTPVTLNVTTVFGEDTRDIEGTQLWRLGMFGSNSPNGTGPKFDEVYQILEDSGAALPIQNRQPIHFGELPAVFEIGTVGCVADVNYVCLEFQKNQNPDPDYVILIQDEAGNDAQSIISCKKQSCFAKAVFEDLTHAFLSSEIIMEGKANPPITVSLEAITNKSESTGVTGEDLWEVSTFFSKQSTGLGPRILEQNQILNRLDDSKNLELGHDLSFPSVEFSTDLTDHECSSIPYICFQLRKNSESSVKYEFLPDPEPLIDCSSTADMCKGVIARFLTWSQHEDDTERISGELAPLKGDVLVDVVPSSRDLEGNSLWKLTTYASSTPNGDSPVLPIFEQVLSPSQSGTPLLDGGPLIFENIETPPYPVDRLGCGESKYLCFELRKSEESEIDYAFETTTGEDVLRECMLQECEAVFVNGMNWTVSSDDPVPGEESPILLDVDVGFEDYSRNVSGSDLWQVSLFGSQSPEGDGERFGEEEQVLWYQQASQMIQKDNILPFREASAFFDIASIGCQNFTHICVEFQSSPYRSVNFSMIVLSESGPPKSSILSCQPRECDAKVTFDELQVSLNSEVLIEGAPDQPVMVDIEAIADYLKSANVGGKNLWRLKSFFSTNKNGSDNVGDIHNQIISEEQANQPYINGEEFLFDNLTFNVDLVNHSCSDIPFICFEMEKDPSSSINYVFQTNPPEEPLRKCVTTSHICEGVIARSLTWSQYEDDSERIPGELAPLKGDVLVDVTPSSRDLEGNSLWKLTTYASSTPNGDSPVLPIFEQVLSPSQSGTPLLDGGPLIFENIETPPYPVDKLGCGESKYLCFELRKSEESEIDYAFKTTTGEDVLRECMLQECEAVFVNGMNWTISSDDPIPGEESPTQLDVDVGFEDYSRNVSGSDLWQVSLFGSQSPEGDGERFGEEEQVLRHQQASQMIQKDNKLPFREASAFFDIASIGCQNFTHICVEFQSSPYRSVNFSMIVLSESGPPKSSILSCQPRECDAKVTFDELQVALNSKVLIEGAPDQPVMVDIEAIADYFKSTNVGGKNLWRLKSFFSTNKDGSDNVGDIHNQIISEEQANQPYINREEFLFDNLTFNVDLVNHSCSDIPFICFEMEKDPSSSINYVFQTNPPEEPLRKCVTTSHICEGVIIEDFNWTMDDPLAVPGVPSSITANVSVSLLPVGRNLTGDNLWKVSFFPSEDNTGIPPGSPLFEQVLSPEWASQSLSPGDDELWFEEIELPPVELFSLSCGGKPYLCLEFSKHESSDKDFTLETTTGEESIIRCHRQECNLAVFPKELSWDLEADSPIPGRATPISLNVSLPFKNTSTPFEGEGLWRVGIFGSNSPTGKQKRFKEVRQILSLNETNLPSRRNVPFVANDIITNFDTGSIGCHKDISYICVEFARGDSPTPGYNFVTDDDEDSVISCKEQECIARVEFDELIPTIHIPEMIIENTNGQMFNVSLLGVTDKERSTLVTGENLWQINTFFTELENGTGERIDEKIQILNDGQESKELLRGDDLPLDFLDFEVNLDGRTCDEIPYMCFELMRNPKANINFKFEETVMKCIDVSSMCKGVVFKSLDFDVDIPKDLKLGEKKPLNVDAVVNLEPYSREVVGDDLWKVAVFPSADNYGYKRKGTYSEQLLMDYQAGTHLPPGGPLVLNDVLTDGLDVRSLACSDYNYLCMEFSKGNTPTTKYTFRTQSDDPSLISCKQLDCDGKVCLTRVLYRETVLSHEIQKYDFSQESRQHKKHLMQSMMHIVLRSESPHWVPGELPPTKVGLFIQNSIQIETFFVIIKLLNNGNFITKNCMHA
ncbi:hypothetical protein HOLleu_41785 [Holothuria leucospilota]|uniref:VWFC domain-containing protein n=1 Tax=Holothuria leucospilota TaxID=206669 RepID=A0A9Q0YEP1_HOLLE|nr:hypothetical protein HOLleu_41785 [Holothuria leucospilota]